MEDRNRMYKFLSIEAKSYNNELRTLLIYRAVI